MNNASVLMTLDQVRQRVPGSDRTFDRRVKRGEFPPPVRVGRLRYWRQDEVEAWITEKSAARAN